MKKLSKLFLSLSILILVLVLTSCKGNEPEKPVIDWSSKDLLSANILESSIEPSYEYDEFSLDMIKIHLDYTDGTSRDIPTTEEMYDEKSITKMKSPGNPRVTLYYTDEKSGEIFEFTFIVHLIDSALLDENLNQLELYDCVIKAIRDKTKDEIMFILEPAYKNITSFQFAYQYDNSIMQLGEVKQSAKLDGTFEIEVKDGFIYVTIILNEPLEVEETLFTVTFTGNFRTSGLRVLESFNNKVYAYIPNEKIEPIRVLYHASVK